MSDGHERHDYNDYTVWFEFAPEIKATVNAIGREYAAQQFAERMRLAESCHVFVKLDDRTSRHSVEVRRNIHAYSGHIVDPE